MRANSSLRRALLAQAGQESYPYLPGRLLDYDAQYTSPFNYGGNLGRVGYGGSLGPYGPFGVSMKVDSEYGSGVGLAIAIIGGVTTTVAAGSTYAAGRQEEKLIKMQAEQAEREAELERQKEEREQAFIRKALIGTGVVVGVAAVGAAILRKRK